MTGTTNSTPCTTSLKQLASLLCDIAHKASEIDRLCYFGADDEVQLQATLDLVRTAVRQMGWMADVGATKLNDYGMGPLRASPEEWLLPASFHTTSARPAQ